MTAIDSVNTWLIRHEIWWIRKFLQNVATVYREVVEHCSELSMHSLVYDRPSGGVSYHSPSDAVCDRHETDDCCHRGSSVGHWATDLLRSRIQLLSRDGERTLLERLSGELFQILSDINCCACGKRKREFHWGTCERYLSMSSTEPT